GPWAKFRGYGARLALVLHLLRQAAGDDVGDDVDGESVLRAAKLVDYFKSQARKVHGVLASDPAVYGAGKVLTWLKQSGLAEFSKRDAHHALESTFSKSADLDGPLGLLTEKGWVRAKRAEKKTEPGRPPSPVYEVSPYLHD